MIMKFLSSRREDFFTLEMKQIIRGLRLFLVSKDVEPRYIDLSDESKHYVCLRKDPTAQHDRVPSLMALVAERTSGTSQRLPLSAFSFIRSST